MIDAIKIVRDYAARTHPLYCSCIMEARHLANGYVMTVYCKPNLSTLESCWRVIYLNTDKQTIVWDMIAD
jgi:hypothetical protein